MRLSTLYFVNDDRMIFLLRFPFIAKNTAILSIRTPDIERLSLKPSLE